MKVSRYAYFGYPGHNRLQDVLSDIHNGRVLLPEGDYEISKEYQTTLVSHVFQGLPIGLIFAWDIDGDQPFEVQTGIAGAKPFEFNTRGRSLILDGTSRLAHLYQAFYAQDDADVLYVDLRKLVGGQDFLTYYPEHEKVIPLNHFPSVKKMWDHVDSYGEYCEGDALRGIAQIPIDYTIPISAAYATQDKVENFAGSLKSLGAHKTLTRSNTERTK